MTTSPLEDTTTHNYVHSPWLSCVRNFLQTINATIIIPAIQTIKCLREHDSAIMDNPNKHLFTKSQLESINACRLFLQVNTIAEITTCKGTLLLPQAVKGSTDENGIPTLWQISTSKLKWPHQPKPPQKSWNIWKRFLQQYTTKTPSNKLSQPLGNWLPTAYDQRHWIFTKYNNNIIRQTQTNIDYYQVDPHQHFFYKTYTKHQTPAIVLPAHNIPIIPIFIGETSIRCGEPHPITIIPPTTTPHQYLPIYINNVAPTIFRNHDIIDIASDGGLINNHSTFGVIISINQIIVTEIHGSLPTQIHPTSLTSEAYGCYYALQKIHEQLNTYTSYSCINLLLDNKSLISRITELRKYKPFPTACLKSEFEIISAIVDIISKLPNINIKHVSSKNQPDPPFSSMYTPNTDNTMANCCSNISTKNGDILQTHSPNTNQITCTFHHDMAHHP
jgi:hypothetical protein